MGLRLLGGLFCPPGPLPCFAGVFIGPVGCSVCLLVGRLCGRGLLRGVIGGFVSQFEEGINFGVVGIALAVEHAAAILLDGDELVEGLPVPGNGGFSGGFDLRATTFTR